MRCRFLHVLLCDSLGAYPLLAPHADLRSGSAAAQILDLIFPQDKLDLTEVQHSNLVYTSSWRFALSPVLAICFVARRSTLPILSEERW